MSNWVLRFRYSQALYSFKINLCMGVARYTYGTSEQTKCFPGMKKKLMLNLIISLISRLAEALIIFHSKLEQKHVVLASMLW